MRVVDKSPENSNYLGLICSVFPSTWVICIRLNPIDTCLSCYFQRFATALNFTLDLSDLAHYYGEYRRITAHWRAVLPPGHILDVPYEELVADQETWSRKMLRFIGLEWDPRVLEFHATKAAGGHRQRLAGAAENVHEFRRSLASLREIHRSPEELEKVVFWPRPTQALRFTGDHFRP